MPQIETYFDKTFLEREGPDLSSVLVSLERSLDRFRAAFQAVPDERLHLAPGEGRWTPAEVADHAVRAGHYFLEGIERALERVQRPETPLPETPMGMLSDAGKPLAPPEEAPRAGRDRAELLADLAQSVADLNAVARRAEQAGALETAGAITHFFGALTALELLRLASWHLRHHSKQL